MNPMWVSHGFGGDICKKRCTQISEGVGENGERKVVHVPILTELAEWGSSALAFKSMRMMKRGGFFVRLFVYNEKTLCCCWLGLNRKE
jgi:hypothetical protein